MQENDLPVAYLCGQDPGCRIAGSKEALAKAKANAEESYAVVGVLELLSEYCDTDNGHCANINIQVIFICSFLQT